MSSPSLLDHLLSLLLDRTAELEGVTGRKMFGCEALFRDGAIFALVWKEGRIGLKLSDPALFAELRAMPGTKPWSPSTVNMSGWLLVPEAFHDDEEALDRWVRHAWTCAANAPPKKSKAARAKAASGPASAGKVTSRSQATVARPRTRAAPRSR
jgi:TfoX/Sxy family transcriptional regulator of competence genes